MNNYINFVNKKYNTQKQVLPLSPSTGNGFVDFIDKTNTTQATITKQSDTKPVNSGNGFVDFIDQDTTITPKAVIAQTDKKPFEAPKSKFKMATQGMGKTLSSILGIISIPETIIGGVNENILPREERLRSEFKPANKLDKFLSSGKSEYVSAFSKPIEGGVTAPVAKKVLKTVKGDLTEIGTQKAVIKETKEMLGKEELNKPQYVLATAASILLDIGISPLTYVTFGGSSGLKIGKEGAKVGLTKAGTKAYATLIKEGVAKGLTREVAATTAKSAMTKMLKSSSDDVVRKLFSKGGVRFAEWIPKVGGESIVPYENISKFVEPIAKYTGLGKAYKGLKNWEMTKAITKAVSPIAGVPEELYKIGKKATAFRRYETAKAAKDYIKPLKELGQFTSNEAEEIFNAIRNVDIYKTSPDKIKSAADIIGKRFDDIRAQLVSRGVDIGYLENYVPQFYEDAFGKEFVENLKNFAGNIPDIAKSTSKSISKGGLKRGKEFFEYPRLLFSTVEAAEAAGVKVKKNIFDLLDAYESGASRINAFMDIADKVKTVGVDITQAGAKIPNGFIRGSGMLANYAFPKDVANYLGSFQKTFFNNAELKTFLSYYDGAMRWWKTMATVVSPGFHSRNFMSNVFNSWLGGNKNPANYIDAAKIFKGTGQITTQAGEKVAGSIVIDEAAKRGILGSGWFAGELGGKKLAQELQPVYKTVLKGINPLGAESYLAKGGKKLGATVEEYSRLTHFIDVFKKTGDFDNAAEETFKYLFDYGELTPFWKNIMNRVFPFGTWMRKNTALQFEQLIKQPGKYRFPVELKKFVESFSEREKPDETYLPEYLKKELAIRLPVKDKTGNFIYARLDLPYLGISDISDWRSLLGSITPAVKIPAELGFRKQIFTGKKIELYPGYTTSVPGYIGILPDWIKKMLGVVRAKNPKTGKLEERMNPYAAYLLNQNPMMSKIGKLIPYTEETQYQTTSRPYSAMSILGGIGITPYDEGYRKKVYEKEQKTEMEAYKKRLKEMAKWKK